MSTQKYKNILQKGVDIHGTMIYNVYINTKQHTNGGDTMSEERKRQLEKAAEVLNGLTAEQANRVMERTTDFMAGAATREQINSKDDK